MLCFLKELELNKRHNKETAWKFRETTWALLQTDFILKDTDRDFLSKLKNPKTGRLN